jgi:hypothetical protein
MRRGVITVVIAMVAIVGSAAQAEAQLKGHYIPGFSGLGNGTQPPPSITLAVPVYTYPTDTIKNDTGDTVGDHVRINASFTGISVIWVTNVKVLGANYGFQVVPADWMKSRIESASLDVPGSFGFSDITAQPVWLGWHKPRADIVAGWSFFAPTGTWALGGDANAGLGMWSNDFQVGTTVHLDRSHRWSTSVLTTYEVHSGKQDSDITTGDIFTFEGGTGLGLFQPVPGSPLPRITNVGVVYYGQMKATADQGTGPLANQLLAGAKDRVFGVGGEINVFLPKPRLLLGARVVPEFGARNRTQGITYLFTIGYQAKLLVKAPAP